MKVTERCEVIFSHQDVGVSEWGQVFGFWVYFVLHNLNKYNKRENVLE